MDSYLSAITQALAVGIVGTYLTMSGYEMFHGTTSSETEEVRFYRKIRYGFLVGLDSWRLGFHLQGAQCLLKFQTSPSQQRK